MTEVNTKSRNQMNSRTLISMTHWNRHANNQQQGQQLLDMNPGDQNTKKEEEEEVISNKNNKTCRVKRKELLPFPTLMIPPILPSPDMIVSYSRINDVGQFNHEPLPSLDFLDASLPPEISSSLLFSNYSSTFSVPIEEPPQKKHRHEEKRIPNQIKHDSTKVRVVPKIVDKRVIPKSQKSFRAWTVYGDPFLPSSPGGCIKWKHQSDSVTKKYSNTSQYAMMDKWKISRLS
eukprot:TRINITY_DN8552_c0_g1_i1.p1 TRINITY_DN8552_c0_g1~~TRINITY_DN8552_c0_g1_i1.p1  ORF type:complete len:232 (+),score=37.14 TRINITY_DN8552_c0_g1_i1:203-898(+)